MSIWEGHIFTTVICTKHNMGKLTIKRDGEVVTFIYKPKITLYLYYIYAITYTMSEAADNVTTEAGHYKWLIIKTKVIDNVIFLTSSICNMVLE